MTRAALRLLPALAAAAMALPAGAAIYTCTDASGRRLTADRPIPECLDREQRELSPTGTTRRVVPPAMTDTERATREESARQEALERQRANEERLKLRALSARYPTSTSLERDRMTALGPINVVLKSAEERLAALDAERERLGQEALRPASAPRTQALARALEQNEQERRLQRRLLADKQAEKDRIHQRFDEMNRLLQPVWSAPPGPPFGPGSR